MEHTFKLPSFKSGDTITLGELNFYKIKGVDKMYCSYCGRELSEGAKFCDQCGKSVKQKEAENDECQTDDNSIIQASVKTSPQSLEEPEDFEKEDFEKMEDLGESSEVSNPLNPKKGIWFILFVVLVGIVVAVMNSWSNKLHGTYWTDQYFLVDRIEFKIDGSFSAFSYLGGSERIYEGKYEEGSNGAYNLFVPSEDFYGTEHFFTVKKVAKDTMRVFIEAEGSYIAWNGESAYFYKR